jgi:phosphoadenosine phosphosulfate reductase
LRRGVLEDGPLAGRLRLVSSLGAESAPLLDMVARVDRATPVIFLDTGKLFAETQLHREALVEWLQLRDVRVVRPEQAALAAARSAGRPLAAPSRCVLSLAQGGSARNHARRFRCLDYRAQALPGRRALATADHRAGVVARPDQDQSAGDLVRRGRERYRVLHDLPKHPVADRAYRSIGCVPCTRPVSAPEAQRAGRWWGLDKSECGIHLMEKAC